MCRYDIEKITDFLEKTHPSTMIPAGMGSSLCYEIKGISRDKKNKYGGPLTLNRQMWNTAGRSKEFLKKFLCEKFPEYSNTCMYYSVSNYYSDGNKRQGINKVNACYSSVLVADFDHIEEEDFLEILKKLENIGLEFITIFSGHGYQIVLLLDKADTDSEMHYRFVRTLLRKGFPVDIKVGRACQLMRLPYTYNCKRWETEEPILTYIYKDTEKRYDKTEIFKLLDMLPDDPDYVVIPEKEKKEKKVSQKKKSRCIVKVSYNSDMTPYANILSEKIISRMPEGFRNMLCGTPEGYRNNAIFILVNYLKTIENCCFDTIAEVIKVWCGHAIPVYDEAIALNEAQRFYEKYNHPALRTAYDCTFAAQFGKVDLDEYYKKECETISISNKIFNSDYQGLRCSSVRLYFSMCIFSANNIEITREMLCDNFGYSQASLSRLLAPLFERKLVEKTARFKKNNENYIYNPVYKSCRGETFTKYNLKALNKVVFNSDCEISNSEFKVFIKMSQLCSGNAKIYYGQTKLGKLTGYNRFSISRITSKLRNASLLIKNTMTVIKDKILEGIETVTRKLADVFLNIVKASKEHDTVSYCTYSFPQEIYGSAKS